uniref:Uncharacterized protein n=1 Tax=Periophthalmus magnuspinnatus TaxID=409849 RepID=A0A3B4APQ5_9GOBI
MEPSSPKRIQFTVPPLQEQLDPQAAEQVSPGGQKKQQVYSGSHSKSINPLNSSSLMSFCENETKQNSRSVFAEVKTLDHDSNLRGVVFV